MKITKYKVPVKLTRDESGKVKLEIFDEKKEQDGLPEELGSSTQDILSLSKTIADENEAQKSIITSTLFASETEREAFITFKYLTE